MSPIEKVKLHWSDTDMANVICFNHTDLSWNKAFYNLTGEVTDYDIKFLNIGQLISDSAIVSVDAVLRAVGDAVEKKVFLKSLLVCKRRVLLRLHSLLKHLIPRQHRKQNKKTGPKLIEDKFPEIRDVATEFIKRKGYKAQGKRRNDDFVSCGVSVQEVREHLLKTIPGLAEHGLYQKRLSNIYSNLYKGCVD